MVDVSQQSTLVERLGARRHVDSRVLREEVDGLEADFEHLARHDWEILDARDMVDAELNEDNEIVVDDVVFAIRPVAHAGTAAGLVGVLSATVQLVFTVLDSVDVVVGEFGSLVIEAVGIGDDLLEKARGSYKRQVCH